MKLVKSNCIDDENYAFVNVQNYNKIAQYYVQMDSNINIHKIMLQFIIFTLFEMFLKLFRKTTLVHNRSKKRKKELNT